MRRVKLGAPEAEELLSQSPGPVFALVPPAPLEFGHKEIDNAGHCFGRNGISEVKAVDAGRGHGRT